MKDNNLENQIGYKLVGVKTEQFAIFEENMQSLKDKISISTSGEIKLEELKKELSVVLALEFKQQQQIVIKLVVSCCFMISGDSWNALLKDKTITFPKEFVEHLTNITVGTARGVLHTKTEDTLFSTYFLPIIAVSDLFDNAVTFSLD